MTNCPLEMAACLLAFCTAVGQECRVRLVEVGMVIFMDTAALSIV